MNTFKYSGFLLLLIIASFSVISTKLILKNVEKNSDMLLLNEILATLLEKCSLGLQNIFVYDHSHGSSYIKTISTIKPPIIVSISSKFKFFKSFNETLTENEIQGVIFIFNPHHAEEKNIIEHTVKKLPLTRNSTIIIIPHFYPRCINVKPVFLTLKELYIFSAYYICFLNNQPVIFTHNVYGEAEPSLWNVDDRKMIGGNTWTLYRRTFRKDTICKKFHFDRTNLKMNSQSANIIFGIVSRGRATSRSSNHKEVYRNKLEKSVLYYNDILATKKLVKMNVKYYFSSESSVYLYRNTSIDVIFSLYFMSHQKPFWNVFYPVTYEKYVILSQNRGFCTPLEKIADFYGLWTFVSLIIILIITFFVIWYKTTKKISSAIFDILRLLINDGVNVPINTLSLKIFFSMIFLYFLVIHSTFSGHLAEFLTKPKLRKNIDSIEDALEDSRILNIYNFGFHYSDSSNQEIFDRKSIPTYKLTQCIFSVKDNESTACIGFESNFNLFTKRNGEERYYIGKQQFGFMGMSLRYRQRFPFVEKFNSAIIFLVETRNMGREIRMGDNKNELILHKRMIRSQVDFRAINLKDIQFAFILLGIGTSLGLLSFFCELLINHFYHRDCKTKNQSKTRITIKNYIKKLLER